MMGALSTEEIVDRLENLYRHLNEEGWYVKANTVALAIDRLKALSIEFDPNDLPERIPVPPALKIVPK